MLQRFTKYNAVHQLLLPADNVLVAVSGGVDSMVLLHILLHAQHKVTVAHCNFGLRGAESDGDEKMVTDFAKNSGIACFVQRFETPSYAAQHKCSIQMAARELRYAWFEQLAEEHGFTKIAVAHNANDAVETFFVNLTRGAGLQGLTGIAAKQGRVVRPLLFAQRSQILEYARLQPVPFREDSSNASTKYARNRIRHLVLPELQKINPSFLHTMQENLEHIAQAKNICQGSVAEVRLQAAEQLEDETHIRIAAIPDDNFLFYLYELLSDFGFSGKVVGEIALAAKGIAGKTFYSPTHQLLKDRDCLIVRQRTGNSEEAVVSITEADFDTLLALSATQGVVFSEITPREVDFSQGEGCAFFDCESLAFPLTLRHWREGDSFVPLGMERTKKLSDFFIDEKMSAYDKQAQWLLCSGQDIAWLVGKRLDNRYKIKPTTKKVLMCQVNKCC